MRIEDIENKIKTTDAIFLYFSGDNCGVCKALMPKIESAFTKNFPKIEQVYINATDFPAIAAHFNIFTIPSILIYFNSKEIKRESRYISVDQLIQTTQRPYELYFN